MKYLFVLMFLAIGYGSCAQGGGGFGDQSMKGVSWKERIYTGGGMGLGFSSQQDFVSVSPLIGYRLTTRFTPGIGLMYRYTNFKLSNPNIELHDYGASIFARFYVIPQLFLHGEYEHLNYEYPATATTSVRYQFNSVLGGGGYVMPLGPRSSVYVMALYNFSYREQGNLSDPVAYTSPWVLRVGANIGFMNF